MGPVPTRLALEDAAADLEAVLLQLGDLRLQTLGLLLGQAQRAYLLLKVRDLVRSQARSTGRDGDWEHDIAGLLEVLVPAVIGLRRAQPLHGAVRARVLGVAILHARRTSALRSARRGRTTHGSFTSSRLSHANRLDVVVENFALMIDGPATAKRSVPDGLSAP